MKVIGKHQIYLGVSAAVILASLILLVVKGLNFGIDFTGGTLLERGFEGRVNADQVQQVLASPDLAAYGLGGSVVQPLEESSQDRSVILIRTKPFDGQEPIAAIDEALEAAFGEVEVRRSEFVGPVIGRELVRQAFWALLLAGAGILIYISLRFEWRFGIAAVLALTHDVIVTLGVLSLLGSEINTPFVAAILTVVGYSINATIVIFDRIRENLAIRKRESLPDLVNASIRQTLARSINTSLTTLLVLVTLYIFGGSSIKDFTLTLLVGVVAGTYSSVFLASPLWYLFRSAADSEAAPQAARA